MDGQLFQIGHVPERFVEGLAELLLDLGDLYLYLASYVGNLAHQPKERLLNLGLECYGEGSGGGSGNGD